MTAASEYRARPKTTGTRVAKVSERVTKLEILQELIIMLQQETRSIIHRCQNVNGNPPQHEDSIPRYDYDDEFNSQYEPIWFSRPSIRSMIVGQSHLSLGMFDEHRDLGEGVRLR